MLKAAVVGATGYAGEELVKILLRHPDCEISHICAKVEKPQKFSEIFPWAKGCMDLECNNLDVNKLKKEADVVFLALPHKTSMDVVPELLKANKVVIDLSADYRLSDVSEYEKWYSSHKDTTNLKNAVYGLPELYRDKIKKTKFVANPGCYPTSVILGLAPLLEKDMVDTDSIIIDSKSGVTGAGRNPSLALHFCEVNENFKAYKINKHQHMPEMNQELSKVAGKKLSVVFVPHLLPINRGRLSTIYTQTSSKKTPTSTEVINIYNKFYKDEKFVRIKKDGEFPQIKDVQNRNFCDIGVTVDGNKIIIISVIDNLVKGASGQAVQNMNIIFGFKETAGLL